MSDDDIPPPSAPWERPARWPSNASGEAGNEPSLAELMSEITASMPAAGSRRRRREAAEQAAAAGEPTGTISASDLIAAFGAGDEDRAGGAADDPAGGDGAGADDEAGQAGAGGDEQAASTAPEAAEPEIAEREPTEPEVTELQTAGAAAAEPTVAEPTVTEPTVAEPGGIEPAVPEQRLTQTAPDRPRRGWWSVGRVVIAVIAVIALAAAGTAWLRNMQPDSGSGSHGESGTGSGDGGAGSGDGAHAGADGEAAQARTVLLIGLGDPHATAGDDENENASGAALPEVTAAAGAPPEYQRADMLMMMHVSADGRRLDTVSVPGDLLIDAPQCKAWDYQSNTLSNEGYASPYPQWRIADTYAVGGSPCTVTAIENLSGLTVDTAIVTDETGIADAVDAISGIDVTMCAPDGDAGDTTSRATDPPDAGPQHLSGHDLPSLTGGDDPQISAARQQVVVAAALRAMASTGVFGDTDRLASVRDAVGAPATGDTADTLGDLTADDITLYPLPTTTDGDDATIADVPHAAALWAALAHDTAPSPDSIPRRTPIPLTTASTSVVTTTPDPDQTLSVAPADIDVQVVNVAGRGGVATRAMEALTPLGFQIEHSDLLLVPGEVDHDITVEYSAGNRAAALTVAAAVPGATLTEKQGLGHQVRLMLGERFDGTVSAIAVGDTVPSSLSTSPSPVTSTMVTTVTTTPDAGDEGPITDAQPGCLR